MTSSEKWGIGFYVGAILLWLLFVGLQVSVVVLIIRWLLIHT